MLQMVMIATIIRNVLVRSVEELVVNLIVARIQIVLYVAPPETVHSANLGLRLCQVKAA